MLEELQKSVTGVTYVVAQGDAPAAGLLGYPNKHQLMAYLRLSEIHSWSVMFSYLEHEEEYSTYKSPIANLFFLLQDPHMYFLFDN